VRLYAGTSTQFIEDSTRNQIAEKLREAFFYHLRYEPPPSEINSWRNSLRAFAQILTSANLLDHGIILEYQIPLTSLRLDVMVSGFDGGSAANAVIVELKQWEKAEPSACENEVVTFVAGRQREVLHPSVQAGRYRTFLADVHTAFYEGPNAIQLFACSYLHNYTYDPDDAIFAAKFNDVMEAVPLFCADHVPKMKRFLTSKLEGGRGADVLNRIEGSEYRPSRKLMEHVAKVIKERSEYVLLDEQLVVYDKVLALADDKFHSRKKPTIIVKGGPGTGKSVIAINLLADLLRRGFNAQYATGSKAFNQTLSKIIGSRGSQQFKSTHQYGGVARDTVDVLIVDEAHRVREHTQIPYRKRNTITQIEELLSAARVTVFFIDDVQIVRPNEIGSASYIREMAERAGHDVSEHQLDVQFRCAGSEGFVNWIDNTLGIRRTANVIWDEQDKFDFKIFATPADLDAAIRAKVNEGFSARMTAGFCWEWSDPLPDGKLVDDVVVGDYRRPWNAKPDAGKLADGIPKAALWANAPGGLEQIGCIYTAQGFEFDYVGVIVGTDLTYDFDQREWRGQRENSCDGVVKKAKDQFTNLVKNTYRVLLTRGMKGCYVCFLDKNTEQFVRTRME
jgi:DUF2075 family protein